MNKDILWVEKYRPSTIDDLILPEEIKSTFREIISKDKIPNLILSGSAGVGKTSAAMVLCKSLNCDYIIINGSDEGRLIETLRNKLTQYCSSVSMSGGRKVVIMDEADYMTPDSVQPAMRGFIERISTKCSFIFTCNFKNRIIEPLHSRCAVVEFNIPKKDMPELCMEFLDRCCYILNTEGPITYEKEVIAELILKHQPDWRRVINELQRHSASGKIDSSILIHQIADLAIVDLITYLKTKNFKAMRQWVADNMDAEPASIFRKLYDAMNDRVEPKSIPQLVLILADYQYKNAFVADHELNMVACLTEAMTQVQFK